jgi:glutamate dehydrogenase/leucine dehydrogenase
VQGYGNAGWVSARLLAERGAKVIAVSDSQGGIVNRRGLDPVAVHEHKKKTGSVVGFKGAEPISNEDLITLPCDILVPAALENMITGANARKVRARIIAEAANGPTTPAADPILDELGVLVIPDILANAGGVTVSYFEWVQDNYSFFWKEEDVNSRLEEIMVRSFHDVLDASKKYRVSMRQAAYALAVERVAEATRVRGIYP